MKFLSLSRTILLPLFALTVTAVAKTGWIDSYEKGLEQAKKEKKPLLVDFTGSDWCVWCIRLDKEVFSQSKFKDFVKERFVLVEIDFPQTHHIPEAQQERNQKLSEKYEIEGFPTVLVLNPDGKKIGQLGYMEGGPDAFIAELEKITAGKK